MHSKVLNIFSVCMYSMLISSCCTVFPWQDRVSLVDRRSVEGTIETRYFGPHAILIAFPQGAGLQEFKGTVTLQSPSQQLFSWNISSRNATQCNWIKDYDAYIINFDKSNQLNEFLNRNEEYTMSARFSVLPKEASLWFSSMRGFGLCVPRAGANNQVLPGA